MPSFSLYSCKVRLGGSVLNEVPKIGVTAPEIEVLKKIHGDDAVLDIKRTGHVERTYMEERERINDTYANLASNIDGQREKKLRLIRDLFGNDRLPLPTELEEIDAAAEAEEKAAEAAKPRRVQRVSQPAFAE